MKVKKQDSKYLEEISQFIQFGMGLPVGVAMQLFVSQLRIFSGSSVSKLQCDLHYG